MTTALRSWGWSHILLLVYYNIWPQREHRLSEMLFSVVCGFRSCAMNETQAIGISHSQLWAPGIWVCGFLADDAIQFRGATERGRDVLGFTHRYLRQPALPMTHCVMVISYTSLSALASSPAK